MASHRLLEPPQTVVGRAQAAYASPCNGRVGDLSLQAFVQVGQQPVVAP